MHDYKCTTFTLCGQHQHYLFIVLYKVFLLTDECLLCGLTAGDGKPMGDLTTFT